MAGLMQNRARSCLPPAAGVRSVDFKVEPAIAAEWAKASPALPSIFAVRGFPNVRSHVESASEHSKNTGL
jgi:hypothetical protein